MMWPAEFLKCGAVLTTGTSETLENKRTPSDQCNFVCLAQGRYFCFEPDELVVMVRDITQNGLSTSPNISRHKKNKIPPLHAVPSQ